MNISIFPSNASLRSERPIDEANILQLMQDQIDMGPRVPGTQASLDFQTWLFETVDQIIWEVKAQSWDHKGIELRNFWITAAETTDHPSYIIGAHYDSRAVADKEPSISPVPGANDGTSGVAGILELMDHIPAELRSSFGFALFDGEDQGGNGMRDENNISWQWIVGSNYFVDQMSTDQISETRAFVLYDMIADDDFRLPFEPGSDSNLISQIWGQAASLGYGDIFVNESGVGLTDDHVPFKNVGIPAIDIIDFTYPEHHTTLDDMDHISASSVAIVVDVTLEWIKNVLTEEISIINNCPTLSDCPITFPSVDDSTSSNINFPIIVSSIFGLTLIIIIQAYLKQKKLMN